MMKPGRIAQTLLTLVSASILAGCASTPPMELSGTVGPAPARVASTEPRGHLVVYSAWDPFAVGDPERNYHEDYTVIWPDANKSQRVQNHLGSLDEGPVALPLPPGTYRVKARATRHGMVQVNVRIEAGRTTVVRLDLSGSNKDTAQSSQVRLPDGELVGWTGGQ